jgi:hypothetical protein
MAEELDCTLGAIPDLMIAFGTIGMPALIVPFSVDVDFLADPPGFLLGLFTAAVPSFPPIVIPSLGIGLDPEIEFDVAMPAVGLAFGELALGMIAIPMAMIDAQIELALEVPPEVFIPTYENVLPIITGALPGILVPEAAIAVSGCILAAMGLEPA